MRRACLLALLLLSCDPQADSDYPGEPLLTLTGQVKSNGPLPPLEAAMLWQRGDPPSMDQQDLATRAPVQATFPASFTVHLYHPPPAAAVRSLTPGEPTWARANAAAIPQGIAAAQIGGALPAAGPAANSYGVDAAHWIIHLSADAPEGSITAWWLGAPMNAGFHLMRVTAVDPACMTAEQLQGCTAELERRGLTEDKAHAFCVAPYRLSPAAPTEQLLLDLGTVGLGPAAGCP